MLHGARCGCGVLDLDIMLGNCSDRAKSWGRDGMWSQVLEFMPTTREGKVVRRLG